jgi:hypothetical protein
MTWDNAGVHPIDRINALAHEADDNVRRQHVVSKVVLKRFAAVTSHRRAGLIEIVDLDRLDVPSKYLGPDGCGYIQNFVRYASRSLEQLWQTVETNLRDAIAACDDRTVFDHPQHVRTLKDAIALHLVRSVHTRPFIDRIWQQNLGVFKTTMLDTKREMLTREFVKKYGLYPGGPECLEVVINDAMAPHLALKDADAYFRASLERLFGLARKHLDEQGLEVSRPMEGEFVLGDAPAVAVASDGRIGLHQGVGVDSATTIALPLGPYLLISTGTDDAFLDLDKERVDRVNLWQVQAAARRVYCRPGSALVTNIRRQRRGSEPAGSTAIAEDEERAP